MNLRRLFAQLADGIASRLGRLLIRRSETNPDSLRELERYQGQSVQALFGDRPREPQMRIRRRWNLRGFRCDELSFPSQHEALSESFRRLHQSAYQANAVVHAHWLRHDDDVRRPTVVYLPSWMQPNSLAEELWLLPRIATDLDVDVVRMQLPYHGRRKPKASLFHGEYFWTADLVRTFEALRQSVSDARALVRWLDRASPGPVGALGMSLGGMVTQALVCFEERLAFAIPIAAHLDLGGVLEDALLLQPMREELARYHWSPADVQAYARSLGLEEVVPRIPKEQIFFIAGKYDRLLHARRIRELWQRWQRPPIHWYEGGHLGIFTHLGSSLRHSRDFLFGLGLVPERSAPTTHLLASPADQ